MGVDVKTALSSTTSFLAGRGLENPRLEAEVLLAHVLQITRLNLYTAPDRPLCDEEIRRFKELLRLRLLGTPTAYITGKKSFLKWEFKVTPAVLIPRPETELLVEKAVAAAEKRGGKGRLLDLGTGSGAVAISLAHYLPECLVDAVDLSPEAVAVAEENTRRLGVEEKVTFYTGDLFSALPPEKKRSYIGIVSNPPYIPSPVISTLSREVRAEPRVALDGGENGLEVIARILQQAEEYLAPGGFLALEHGADQWVSIKERAEAEGFQEIASYKDLAGHARVMIFSREDSKKAGQSQG